MKGLNPKCELCKEELTDGEFKFAEYVKRPAGSPYKCYQCRKREIEAIAEKYKNRVKFNN